MGLEDNDNDFETLTIVNSNTDNWSSHPQLKCLWKGCTMEDTISSTSIKKKASNLFSVVVVDDDDIDDFFWNDKSNSLLLNYS